MSQKLKLNLGCGAQVIEGWTNVDYALGARLARTPLIGSLVKKTKAFGVNWDPSIYVHNLTTKFPWADGTVDVAYTSHTLEHMSLEQGKAFLKECYRVLRPGGILRVIVPDLRPIVDRYLSGETPAENFLDTLHVLYSQYDSKLKTGLAPFIQFPHKCMYDQAALLRTCHGLGIPAQAATGFESGIEDIRKIELENRVQEAVIIEAVKV